MVALLLQLNNAAWAVEISKNKLDKIFEGYNASFLMENVKTGEKFYYNKERTQKRFAPCSTFKIFNSLVALDTGILKNESESKKWDGTVYSIKSWNRSQTLQSAVTNSCLWYFQKVAKDIGCTRMQKYINQCNYGNKVITGDISKFWLGNSLKISQEEQVRFIKQLIADELPVSKRSMAIVRGMIRANQTDLGTLYGKTGSDMNKGKFVLGWYVGYVVTAENTYAFATNIEGADNAWGPKARTMTKTILKEMKLL